MKNVSETTQPSIPQKIAHWFVNNQHEKWFVPFFILHLSVTIAIFLGLLSWVQPLFPLIINMVGTAGLDLFQSLFLLANIAFAVISLDKAFKSFDEFSIKKTLGEYKLDLKAKKNECDKIKQDLSVDPKSALIKTLDKMVKEAPMPEVDNGYVYPQNNNKLNAQIKENDFLVNHYEHYTTCANKKSDIFKNSAKEILEVAKKLKHAR